MDNLDTDFDYYLDSHLDSYDVFTVDGCLGEHGTYLYGFSQEEGCWMVYNSEWGGLDLWGEVYRCRTEQDCKDLVELVSVPVLRNDHDGRGWYSLPVDSRVGTTDDGMSFLLK
jgi:hypothetical protein